MKLCHVPRRLLKNHTLASNQSPPAAFECMIQKRSDIQLLAMMLLHLSNHLVITRQGRM